MENRQILHQASDLSLYLLTFVGVTVQSMSRHAIVGEPASGKRSSIEEDQAQQISFKRLKQTAAASPEGTNEGQLRQLVSTAAAALKVQKSF
jgi:hypothetical protein